MQLSNVGNLTEVIFHFICIWLPLCCSTSWVSIFYHFVKEVRWLVSFHFHPKYISEIKLPDSWLLFRNVLFLENINFKFLKRCEILKNSHLLIFNGNWYYFEKIVSIFPLIIVFIFCKCTLVKHKFIKMRMKLKYSL